MTKELRKSALRMLARANSLGLVSKTGAPLVVDQIEELIAADHGYRNVHAYKAALASRETPALVQEHPDEAGNDYKLIAGKGVWVKMGRFSVHPYLTDTGVVVDIHTAFAQDEILDTASASDLDLEDALLEHHGLDKPSKLEEFEAWLETTEDKNYDDETLQSRLALIEKFAAMQNSSIAGPSSNGFDERMGTAEDVAAQLNHDADSTTTLQTVEMGGSDYDLRICKLGANAFFEWVGEDGDPVGDMFYERTSDTTHEFLKLFQQDAVTSQETRTIYCIALEGDAETGVEWYFNEVQRDAASGTLGAEKEVPFEMPVPANADNEEITKLADRAAWEKTYFPKDAA